MREQIESEVHKNKAYVAEKAEVLIKELFYISTTMPSHSWAEMNTNHIQLVAMKSNI